MLLAKIQWFGIRTRNTLALRPGDFQFLSDPPRTDYPPRCGGHQVGGHHTDARGLKARRLMGCVYRQKNIWWIKFYRNGKPVYESSESRDRTAAKRLLKLREGDAERGEPVLPKAGRLRFDEAAQDLINEYTINH